MDDAHLEQCLDEPAIYEIRVSGRLGDSWLEWFAGMTVTVEAGDDQQRITTLVGEVADEAALQGLLGGLYSLGVRLLSVNRLEAGPEQAGSVA